MTNKHYYEDQPVQAARDIPWSELVFDANFRPGEIAIPKGAIGSISAEVPEGATLVQVFWYNLSRDLMMNVDALYWMKDIPAPFGLEWDEGIPDVAKLTMLALLDEYTFTEI